MSNDGITVNGEIIINIYNSNEDLVSEKEEVKSVHKIRTSNAVTSAKKRVKGRDCVCQCCGELPTNGHLEVHHIMPIAKYQDLAADEQNMISLCQKCHRKYHDMYSDEDVGAVTFAKYLKDYGNRRY